MRRSLEELLRFKKKIVLFVTTVSSFLYFDKKLFIKTDKKRAF